jgi:hypothetical protein
MNPSLAPALATRPRVTAAQREQRRIRIMALVQSGVAYDAIARMEQITAERVRQIVKTSLESHSGASRPDPRLLQIARLEPALRLAAMGVVNGNIRAIPELLRVMKRLDEYGAVIEHVEIDWAETHERLMKKINNALQRGDKEKAEKTAAAETSPPTAQEAAAAVAEGSKCLDSQESALEAF